MCSNITQNKNFGLLTYWISADPPPLRIGLNTNLRNDNTGQQPKKFSQRKEPPRGDILCNLIFGCVEATKPKKKLLKHFIYIQ